MDSKPGRIPYWPQIIMLVTIIFVAGGSYRQISAQDTRIEKLNNRQNEQSEAIAEIKTDVRYLRENSDRVEKDLQSFKKEQRLWFRQILKEIRKNGEET